MIKLRKSIKILLIFAFFCIILSPFCASSPSKAEQQPVRRSKDINSVPECVPVSYYFCSPSALNHTIITSREVNENSDYLRSLDDHTNTASVLYEFMPENDASLCFLRWKKLICSSWFPKCVVPISSTTPAPEGATRKHAGSEVCRETCNDLMSECPPEKAMNEIFLEKDKIYSLLLDYAENFKINAFKKCEIFPPKADNPNCDPRKDLILAKPSNTSQTDPNKNLSLSCSVGWGTDEKPTEQYRLVRYWVLYWALVCLISSVFTFATFLIDRSRFKYPEKATVFISFCYVMISAVYVVGFFVKTSFSCSQTVAGSEVSRGLGNFGCVVSFAVQYYFLMSLSMWWVVFGLTWFLAAGLKWCQDIMDRTLWFMFHGFAWGVPAIKTIFIIASKQIDGDVFTGTCFTGYSNPIYLWSLVIAPFAIYLVTGFTLLLAGFVSLYLIRKEIRKEPNMSEKAERVIFRVVMFVLIYVMAAAILISVFLYEDSIRPRSCSRKNPFMLGKTSMGDETGCLYRRSTTALIVKYFMLFIPGTLAGFWLWTPKTISTWKEFLSTSKKESKRVQQIERSPRQAMESKSVRVHISGGTAATSPVSIQSRPLTDLERAILCHPMNRGHFQHPAALLDTKFSDMGSFL